MPYKSAIDCGATSWLRDGMTSKRAQQQNVDDAPLDRLVELIARIEVERYLAELENANDVREDAGCKGGDLRQIQQ